MKILALIMLSLCMGCSSIEANHTFVFDDGTVRNVKTVEMHPSVLNVVTVTAIEDPRTHNVETAVMPGLSTGKATLDVVSDVGMMASWIIPWGFATQGWLQ